MENGVKTWQNYGPQDGHLVIVKNFQVFIHKNVIGNVLLQSNAFFFFFFHACGVFVKVRHWGNGMISISDHRTFMNVNNRQTQISRKYFIYTIGLNSRRENKMKMQPKIIIQIEFILWNPTYQPRVRHSIEWVTFAERPKCNQC